MSCRALRMMPRAAAAVAIAGAPAAVPRLVKLMESPAEDVQYIAARILGDLMRDSQAMQARVVAAGGVPPMVRLMDSPSQITYECGAMLCCFLAVSGVNGVCPRLVSAGAIPLLSRLLLGTGCTPTKTTLTYTVGLLGQLALESRAKPVIGAMPGVVSRLVALLAPSEDKIQLGATHG